MADVAAETADFLDEARRDELVLVGRHQEQGFHPAVEACVHGRHLEFVFEVGNRPQAADDDEEAPEESPEEGGEEGIDETAGEAIGEAPEEGGKEALEAGVAGVAGVDEGGKGETP